MESCKLRYFNSFEFFDHTPIERLWAPARRDRVNARSKTLHPLNFLHGTLPFIVIRHEAKKRFIAVAFFAERLCACSFQRPAC